MIEINKESHEGSTEEAERILEKYDIPQMVADITGLDWKNDSLKLVHTTDGANWQGTDTILVNLDRGVYCVSGASHELVHLAFRQNDWLENPKISEFIDRYPEMKDYPEGKKGYPIEQMVAYLVQDEICKKIGEEERVDGLIITGGHGPFEEILSSEYTTPVLEKLGREMIDQWPERKNHPDVIKWIENIIKEFEN